MPDDFLDPLAEKFAKDLVLMFEPYLPASWLTDLDFHTADLALWLAAFNEIRIEKRLKDLRLVRAAHRRATRYYIRELRTELHGEYEAEFMGFWLGLVLLRVAHATDDDVSVFYAYVDLLAAIRQRNLN